MFVSRNGAEWLVQGIPPIQGFRWTILGFPPNLGALVLLPLLPCRCVLFNPDGCCLYAGSQDALRVYGWEPERCFEVVLVNWGKVADLSICNNQLVSEGFLTDSGSVVVPPPLKGLPGGPRGRSGRALPTLLLAREPPFPLVATPGPEPQFSSRELGGRAANLTQQHRIFF